MGKEKVLRVRIEEYEEASLFRLEKKYGLTKSQIVREGIANFESIHENRIYPLRVEKIVRCLGEDYSVDSCGIIGDDILLGKGLWIDFHSNYFTQVPKCIQYGNCNLTMNGNKIHVEGGYLDDIKKTLMILYRDRKKGGIGMSYFSISDDDDNVKTYVLTSYEIESREESVFVKFKSMDFSVSYELRPDMRFKTVDIIKEYLENILKKVILAGYTLMISEYLVRMYVTIGYDNEEEYETGQFTASKR